MLSDHNVFADPTIKFFLDMMGNSENMNRYLDVQGKMLELSVINAIRVATILPGASEIHSANEWAARGNPVRKDAKSALLWLKEDLVNGQDIEFGYRDLNVYDISSTRYPEKVHESYPLEKLAAAIIRAMKQNGMEVKRGSKDLLTEAGRDLLAYFDPKNCKDDKPVIRAVRLGPERLNELVFCLFHEWILADIYRNEHNTADYDRRKLAVQANCETVLLCKAFGVKLPGGSIAICREENAYSPANRLSYLIEMRMKAIDYRDDTQTAFYELLRDDLPTRFIMKIKGGSS